MSSESGQQASARAEQKVTAALELLEQFGQQEGASHHQTWLLDQVARILTGPRYVQWVEAYRQGAEYDWSEGLAP